MRKILILRFRGWDNITNISHLVKDTQTDQIGFGNSLKTVLIIKTDLFNISILRAKV